MALIKKQQNIWCYTAQNIISLGGSRGPTSTSEAIQDACGASWRDPGGDQSHNWE